MSRQRLHLNSSANITAAAWYALPVPMQLACCRGNGYDVRMCSKQYGAWKRCDFKGGVRTIITRVDCPYNHLICTNCMLFAGTGLMVNFALIGSQSPIFGLSLCETAQYAVMMHATLQ